MSDHIAFYEMGIRLHQAALYHTALFQERQLPGYGSAMHSLWAAFYELPDMLRGAIGDRMGDIFSCWNESSPYPGMERLPSGQLVSYLLPILDEVKRLMLLDGDRSGCMVPQAGSWCRLGVVIADGRISGHQWAWERKDELDKLLAELKARLDSLFPKEVDLDLLQKRYGVSYPGCYRGWYNLEAGLLALKATRAKPSWNKDQATLSYKGVVVKRIRSVTVATNVVPVLDTFEREGWPHRIHDPLGDQKDQQRLHECIKRLNKKLEAIRFEADGTGQGIRWKPL